VQSGPVWGVILMMSHATYRTVDTPLLGIGWPVHRIDDTEVNLVAGRIVDVVGDMLAVCPENEVLEFR
jgi:hypothetical protein